MLTSKSLTPRLEGLPGAQSEVWNDVKVDGVYRVGWRRINCFPGYIFDCSQLKFIFLRTRLQKIAKDYLY
jgi:hypothetical protein